MQQNLNLHQEGYEAYQAGITLDECPYEDDMWKYLDYAEGWMQAEWEASQPK